MICNCGGLFHLHKTVAGWAGSCKACGRRHTITRAERPWGLPPYSKTPATKAVKRGN
jgi:hypothetical protein